MSAIRTENLSVAFGQPVLRDVTVDIAEGDFVALMGANGTGKTTLVRAMLGLVKPDRGSAWLFDAPVAKFRQWQRVAYVPQRLLAHSAVPLSVAMTPDQWTRLGLPSRMQLKLEKTVTLSL